MQGNLPITEVCAEEKSTALKRIDPFADRQCRDIRKDLSGIRLTNEVCFQPRLAMANLSLAEILIESEIK